MRKLILVILIVAMFSGAQGIEGGFCQESPEIQCGMTCKIFSMGALCDIAFDGRNFCIQVGSGCVYGDNHCSCNSIIIL